MRSASFRPVAIFSVLLLLSFLAACTPSGEGSLSSGGALEVIDQVGRTVSIDKVPERIISLAPSNTEILFALGLEDKIVAVTDYCDYPPEAKTKPSIGGFSTPNIEEVVALSPDLVLATSIHKDEVIPQLERLGLTVLALDPKTVDEVLEAISLVGKFTGKEEQAAQLTTELRNRVKVVTEKTLTLTDAQKPRILYLVWHDPLMAASAGTLQDDLLQKAGGINIARDLTGYATISLETVIEADPEVMVAGGGHGSGQEAPFQYIETEPRLGGTSARQNHRVYMIDANIVSRPGPRIVDGLEELARFIHSEIFSSG